MERYLAFANANLGTAVADPKTAVCPALSERQLIATCVNRLCAADNDLASNALTFKGATALQAPSKSDLQICALGPEALSVQLALENKKAQLTSMVTSLPKVYATASKAFDYVESKIAEQATNSFMVSIPGPGDGTMVTFNAEPSSVGADGAKFSVTFVLPAITGITPSNSFTVELLTNIMKDPYINTLHIRLSSPQVKTEIPGLTVFEYQLPLGAFFCRKFFNDNIRLCLIFAGTALQIRVYFGDDDVAFRKTLAVVNLSTRTLVLLPPESPTTFADGSQDLQTGGKGGLVYG
eukprot:GSA120T00008392001.1